jgi:(1->4)-alpha-D-glucan 1-alpha-D-glucosylmutase
MITRPNIPLATYRLQFNRDFTFAKATELVPYLASLGITHCYASPYLRARPGSTHGYDIIDHNTLNPEIGTSQDFECFVQTLHRHGMGQILDIVPNHMGVMGSDNAWWLDVLENGQSSDYAEYFDIDWEPLKDELQGKVLVPVLGDQYGNILDQGELKLTFEKEKGEFSIFYHQHRFPVNPREYPRILGRHLELLERQLESRREELLEFQSLISAFTHLPSRSEIAPEQKTERMRDKEIHKRRLATRCKATPEVTEFIENNVRELNGKPGESSSFNELHELIKAQAYRLAYWRVAADDINYRRFFDINDLAGLRMENEAVFEVTHRFVFDLLRQGKVDGLRIDHPDGLYDPAQYFRRLQCSLASQLPSEDCDAKSVYVVIEKILTGGETLPERWPVFGTTGYEFGNLVNGLFVDPDAVGRMDRIYRTFLGRQVNFDSLLYRSKKIMMHTALASELTVLANLLTRIALSNRHTCDFTVNSLRDALSKVVASFPVYRTYISEGHVSATDCTYIEEAVHRAKRQSPGADQSVFDFVRDVLLIRSPEGQGRIYKKAVTRFAMKFQQFTSAVMAKGLEDTSFYRYHRLTSLNEVGGDPRTFGVSVEQFHRQTMERAKAWPHSMLDTSTHDTKRSEDVRSRINVLSEIPAFWRKRVRRWRELNHDKKNLVADVEAPARNDEYLLYQILIGSWPSQAVLPASENTAGKIRQPADHAAPAFIDRIKEFMVKAVREAKEKTSWANPNTDYEEAVTRFVENVLDPGRSSEFLADFVPFQKYVARVAMFHGLSRTLIKLTSPGVPDIYQGNEIWEFSLVDPDNRRPVDYGLRRQMLDRFETGAKQEGEPVLSQLSEMMHSLEDGRVKLYLIWKTLNLRKQFPSLFTNGEYVPLTVQGEKAKHLIAFARRGHDGTAIVIAPRLCAQLWGAGENLPVDSSIWKNTRVELPFARNRQIFRNLLTSEALSLQDSGSVPFALASTVLAGFPVALLMLEE